jgi:flagellar basal-body rod protein FlgC
MDFDSAMKISGSGLTANRAWMNTVSSNLANMNANKTETGLPYQRKTIICESQPASQSFDDVMSDALNGGIEKVSVEGVVPDGRDFKRTFDPSNPDADKDGYVLSPNINNVEEMANMLTASQSYEANLAALNTAKSLALKTLDIAK